MNLPFISPAERISLVASALAFIAFSPLVLAETLLIQILWMAVGFVLLRRLFLAAIPYGIPGSAKVASAPKAAAQPGRQPLVSPVTQYEYSN